MQKLNLHKIKDIETIKKLAVMLLPEFREYVKTHKQDSYKNYNRIYRQTLADKSICVVDDIEDQLKEKFRQLTGGQAM